MPLVLLALAGVVSGCSLTVLRPPVVVFVDADQPARVRIGERAERFPAAYHAYFPEEVVIHPGDVVNFELAHSGEPHTVTLGTLVDAAVERLAGVDAAATAADIDALAEVRALPALFHPAEDGPPDLNGSAALPCFLENADPPVGLASGPAPACPESSQPDFDGTWRYFNSGFLAEGDVFTVRFSADIAPGTYHVVSLAAPAVMRGRVVVVRPPAPRPRAYDVKRSGSEQMSRLAVTLESAAKVAAEALPGRPLAGVSSADSNNAYVTAFAPREIRVRAGRSLTWTLQGLHTVSFNHPTEAADGIVAESDGRVFVNEAAWSPAGSPPLPHGSWQRVPPPGHDPIAVDAGPWDGRQYRSSGVIAAFVRPATYTMSFAEPGRYAYRCLVHDRMRGLVVVT